QRGPGPIRILCRRGSGGGNRSSFCNDRPLTKLDLVSFQQFADQPIEPLMHQANIGFKEIGHSGSGSKFINGVATSLSKKQVDAMSFGVRSDRAQSALVLPPHDEVF